MLWLFPQTDINPYCISCNLFTFSSLCFPIYSKREKDNISHSSLACAKNITEEITCLTDLRWADELENPREHLQVWIKVCIWYRVLLFLSLVFVRNFEHIELHWKENTVFQYRPQQQKEDYIIIVINLKRKQVVSGITSSHQILKKGRWHRVLRLCNQVNSTRKYRYLFHAICMPILLTM